MEMVKVCYTGHKIKLAASNDYLLFVGTNVKWQQYHYQSEWKRCQHMDPGLFSTRNMSTHQLIIFPLPPGQAVSHGSVPSLSPNWVCNELHLQQSAARAGKGMRADAAGKQRHNLSTTRLDDGLSSFSACTMNTMHSCVHHQTVCAHL